MKKYDVIVIGAGPAGYPAAIRAAQLEASVAVVEKNELGGVCLNKGCIPTKSLIHAANLYEEINQGKKMGIEANPKIDLAKLILWKDSVIKRLGLGILSLFKSYGIELIKGSAFLKTPEMIEINGQEEIKAKKIIIATGSSSFIPKGFEIDHRRFITSDDVLSNFFIPKDIAIIGGGAIGCEFACLFNKLGAKVSVYEMMEHLLPGESLDVGEYLENSFKKRGIEVFTNRKINLSELSTEKVLISIGRKPNSENLGLKEIGIEMNEKGFVTINERAETNVPGIYAAGDITGKGLLAYLATYQGVIAAENSRGKEEKINYSLIPSCIFTDPEIGTIGKREEGSLVGRFPFLALGKSYAENRSEGFIKVIAEKESEKIVGGQIVGEKATELIAIITTAIRAKMNIDEFSQVIYGHPTFSEGIKEAILDLKKKAIHLPKSSSANQ